MELQKTPRFWAFFYEQRKRVRIALHKQPLPSRKPEFTIAKENTQASRSSMEKAKRLTVRQTQ
jgi:hypothetical protein